MHQLESVRKLLKDSQKMDNALRLLSLCYIFGSILTESAANPIPCRIGECRCLDPQNPREICVCNNGTYLKDGKCELCTPAPLPGSREEIKRPCTSTSNTEIGCDRYSYRRYERHDPKHYVCMSCNKCEPEEEETVSCTEFHDRECTPKPSVNILTQVAPAECNCSYPTQPTLPKTTAEDNIQNKTSATDDKEERHSNEDGSHGYDSWKTGFIIFAVVVGLEHTIGFGILFRYLLRQRRDRVSYHPGAIYMSHLTRGQSQQDEAHRLDTNGFGGHDTDMTELAIHAAPPREENRRFQSHGVWRSRRGGRRRRWY